MSLFVIAVRVTLWEENIDVLEEQASYCLQNFVVREFGSSKYLGMAMQGSQVMLILERYSRQKKQVGTVKY